MAPKPAALASTGKRALPAGLTGPPEGYNRKKELQVKDWIRKLPPSPPDEAVSEVSVHTVVVSRKTLWRIDSWGIEPIGVQPMGLLYIC